MMKVIQPFDEWWLTTTITYGDIEYEHVHPEYNFMFEFQDV